MGPVTKLCFPSLLCLMLGCGSESLSTADSGTPPPHEGELVPIVNSKGLIEVVKKTGKAPIESEVSFYFYQDQKYTPFDALPEKGTFEFNNRKVELTANDDALVTPKGPVLFANRDVEGVLTVELDGEAKRIPIGLR